MSGIKPLLVVVDDEQGILDVVSRFAQRVGYLEGAVVATAETGEGGWIRGAVGQEP